MSETPSNPLPPTPLLSLRTGRIAPLGDEGLPSAIRKQPLSGLTRLTALGLAGDEQADRQHHGGPDKALHLYPAQHYALWRAELPAQAGGFVAGGFGENLSTLGLDEDSVCLGDIFCLGSAVIQVSQGRSPCRKLELVFGVPDMAQRVRASVRTGWYYRVLTAGEVTPESVLTRVERPCPAWPVARLFRTLFHEAVDASALTALARLPELSENWRARAVRRVEAFERELNAN